MAKILIVDDDRAALRFLEDALVRDYEIDVAGGGIKGWEKLQSQNYDLLILDWDMPDLSGIDLLQKFRSAGGTAPVLMLTGRNTAEDKVEGLDLGADDYLTKPFNLKELSARIRAALRKHPPAPPLPKALGTNNEELLNRANLMGTTLAQRYEFLEFIGEGAVGMVLKARNPSLDKLVAIKMLLLSGLKKEAIARFEQEAKIIGRLEHPGIAAVYDFGVTEYGQSYMVMEYVEGRTLAAILHQCFCLPLRLSLHLGAKICESMAHAHSRGILHRDLKPANVMVKEAAGLPPATKLLDFGCGKFRDLRSENVALTQDGTTLGSPPYMSPEQVRGKPADERSDIYSLACVIYEMLTGYPPFMGTHPNEIMLKHLQEPAPPLKSTRPDASFPPSLEELLAKALAKDPLLRQQSMAGLLEDLKKVSMAK